MKPKCTFEFCSWPVGGTNTEKYTCKVTEAAITEPTEIEGFIGNHIEGMTNDDVVALWITNQVVEHFPKGLLKIFPNLMALHISYCGLKQITKKDLAGFGKLEILALWANKITTLEEDLLINTPNLKWLSFGGNLIEKVPSKFLKPVSGSLEYANFRGNKRLSCYFDQQDKKTLENLIFKVIEKSNVIAEEKRKVAALTQKVTDLTNKVTEERQKVEVQTKKVAEEGQKVAGLTQKVTDLTNKVIEERQKGKIQTKKVAEEGQKVAGLTQKVTDLTNKVTEERHKVEVQTKKVTEEVQKVTDLTHKNADLTNKITEERQNVKVQVKKIADLTKKVDSQSKKFGEIFASCQFSDLTIKVHGKNHKVHKCILAAQSSVFEELFTNDNKDKVHEMKKIPDFGEEIFNEFLRFFYTRSLQSEEHSKELFQLAVDFDVAELKATCEEAILKSLDEANALELFNFGGTHSEKLKRAAFDLLKKMHPEIPEFLYEEPEGVNIFVKAKIRFAEKK